ncbi:MAG: TRAP transporter large permease subunit [Bacteroidetes bacterium]|nr:MAG: TRAP transporter large permease subunit [Bacteroidota bacterium]
MTEYLSLILFTILFVLLLLGFPVAFTLGGVSVLFGLIFLDTAFFSLLPMRIFGIMNNYVLISVPLFVFMGVMLERSGIAERLLETMSLLMGRIKGGLAMSVVLVGAMLAASTGVVGATVVTMGLLSLPTMLKKGYSPELATGTIASSGTLGQIIPPSVVLVLLGSTMNVSVGDLFTAAVIPGLALVVLYLIYIFVFALIKPKLAPSVSEEELAIFRGKGLYKKIFTAFFLPMILIISVLGSIFFGIASPTEAAGVGAMVATILTAIEGKLNYEVLKTVMKETTYLTSMVFTILIGATAFGLIFRALGGDAMLIKVIQNANLSPYAFLAFVMVGIFFAGFFIDFIEIIFIFIPVVTPIFVKMHIDLLWVAILIAVNLQTSFLTPPFGFSLFYLKGVAPPEITTGHLYRGIIPFVLIQLFLLILMIIFPEIISFLPNYLKEK